MNDEYIKIDNNEKRKKKKYESCSRVTKNTPLSSTMMISARNIKIIYISDNKTSTANNTVFG